jgi:hypothetical protein
MPRKLDSTPRDFRFCLWLSKEERAMIETLAKARGLTAADVMRSAMRAEFEASKGKRR